MPTSPLPSSASMPGIKWPKVKTEDCKMSTIDETGDSASGKCFYECQGDSEVASGCFSDTRKLTVDIGKPCRESELGCEETKPFLGDEEGVSLQSKYSTKTAYKGHDNEEGQTDSLKTHKSKVTYCKSRCESCVRLNYEQQNPCDRMAVSMPIPENRDELNSNKFNRSKLKKKRRSCLCKVLLTAVIVVLLVAVTALVTYLLTNKPREIPTEVGDDPKDEESTESVTNEPYMSKINRLLLSRIFPERGKPSKKLSGIYMNLDTKSLTDAGSLIKWKPPPREKFGRMENRDIQYSNGLFTVLRDGWYIVYSKLYLVTYKEYDKSGHVIMNLYNYQHCVDFDVNLGDQKIDSICNLGSLWGGHKGANHIWKPVFLKEGVSVKVTMKNKPIVSPDDLFSSFEMIELTPD